MVTSRDFAKIALATVATAGLVVGVSASSSSADDGRLQMYTSVVSDSELQSLLKAGIDVVDAEATESRLVVDLVLSARERTELIESGFPLQLWRNPDGLTATQLAAAQQQDGFDVFRSWDEEGGIRDELQEVAADYPEIIKLETIGTSVQDRPILALKVTKDANSTADGSRPAVLYASMQHAREWISVEVNRRLLRWFVEGYGVDDRATELVDNRELWFVVVANPDGYQYTFEEDRMWRKNLRDNDGDGELTDNDGVDPNRNFDAHWGYDPEGSSGNMRSDSYRGGSAASEPETQAMQGLLDRIDFSFMVNYHSYGPDLLYGAYTWQIETPSADEAIYLALSGDREAPAIEGFYPHSMLYLTNGNTREYAHGNAGALCWTPELSDGGSGDGFIFPDDEELVQREFEINLPFALDVAWSAADPAQPVSHLGNTVTPLVATDFDISYGSPQPVEVNAARYCGAIEAKYTINGGPVRSGSTHEWHGGERYGDVGDEHLHIRRGKVTGAAPDDQVTVWFEAVDGSCEPSDKFTYEVASDTGRRILVLAVEDYTGLAPRIERDELAYLDYYLDALDASGLSADVYDFDAHGRSAPSHLGVLSHYEAVIWYTGDDIVTRDPGMMPGTATSEANEMWVAVRDYLNEGGRVLYTGKYAAYQFSSQQFYHDLEGNEPCGVPGGAENCGAMRDDFMQYYMGVNSYDRNVAIDTEIDNMAGDGVALVARGGRDANQTIERTFDVTDTVEQLSFSFDAFWGIETGYDYGYFEVTTDGGQSWATLPDNAGYLTNDDPHDQNDGWGLTGYGQDRLTFDLSAYSGYTGTLGVRLRYSTDRRTLGPGWYVDNLRLADASGVRYANDLEMDHSDWTASGWEQVPPAQPEGPTIYVVQGIAEPFDGMSWHFRHPTGAANQDHSAAAEPTSRDLPADDYPQFTSWGAGVYERPEYAPHSGEYHIYSDATYYTYQRLTRTVDLADVADPSLTFWIRHDVRVPWDVVFVEAHTPDKDDWTTLPEVRGHTDSEVGLNCTTESWFSRHPQLAHYMSVDSSGDTPKCVASGSTGVWNAATGSSDGWQQWSFDLGEYAGATVELSIAYVSSRLAYRGVFIDDVEIAGVASTSFEDGMGGWEVSGAPEGSAPNPNDFFRASIADQPTAAIVVTEDTIFFGFGFEGVGSEEDRNGIMGRAMDYLLGPPKAIYLPAAYAGR